MHHLYQLDQQLFRLVNILDLGWRGWTSQVILKCCARECQQADLCYLLYSINVEVVVSALPFRNHEAEKTDMHLVRYTGSSLVADVSYDLWLAPSVGANNAYEIMVWLGSYGGAGPISSTGSTPIATPTIAGTKWNLFKGPNGDTTVFSFVAPSNIASFSGDLKAFFTYLVSSQGVSSSYVVTSLQAGTEPFTGMLNGTVVGRTSTDHIFRLQRCVPDFCIYHIGEIDRHQ